MKRLRAFLFVFPFLLAACQFSAAPSSDALPESTQGNTPTITPVQISVGGGGRIAFEIRSGSASKLHTVNPDGSDLQDVAGRSGYLAGWSPDGQQMVYVAGGRSNKNDLFVADADGSNMRRLTNTVQEEGIPAWSPDGASIAVSINLDGDAEIYLLDIVSGEVIAQLTDNEDIDDYMGAWSPDGKQIAYVTNMGSPESTEIHLMDADGENKQALTVNEVLDFYPAWSPSGKQIAFVSERNGNGEIYLMDRDGLNVHRLTNDPNWDSRPAWSPDGTVIAFHSQKNENISINLVDIETGEVWQLVEDGVHPAWSSAGAK